MAYDFNAIKNPILKRLFNSIFHVDTGHDHDGVNSKLLSSSAAPADGSVTNAKLAADVKAGSLAALTTDVKTSLQGAINEVDAHADSAAAAAAAAASTANSASAAASSAASVANGAASDAAAAVAAVAAKITASSEDTLTNKTIDGDDNTLQDIPYSAIKEDSRSGSDATLITGTAGTADNLAKWNADGDLVDGPAPTGADAALVSGTAGTADNLAKWNADGDLVDGPALTGADAAVVSGTAGTDGNLAAWNADGDLVDGPTPPTGDIVGTSDVQELSSKTLLAPNLTFGSTPKNYAGHADWELSAEEEKATVLRPTNADAPVNIIGSGAINKIYVVINGTGQALTIKAAGQTGVTIADGKTAIVIGTGTDYARVTEDAS